MKLKLTLSGMLALGLSALTANACSVFGHVACRPGGNTKAGITVNVTDVNNNPVGSGVTDGSGAYLIEFNNPAGTYTVCVDLASLPGNATLVGSDCQTVNVPDAGIEVDFQLGGDFCSSPPSCQPVHSCITSGFNGTSISPGNCIWFNANFTAKGIPATGATVVFANSTITINGTTHGVPGGTIHFSPTATCATTFFDGAQWVTTLPVSGSDEIFLSGFAFAPTTDLRAASVTWCGDFSADTSGVSISWKWGAAVYTCLCGMDANSILVKPTHNNACGINNGDHAGTPENTTLQHCVIGGARGGGGSNFTGSWSGTASAGLCP